MGGEGDGPPTSRGLCGEVGARRIGVLLEERHHGLDLQGEIKKNLLNLLVLAFHSFFLVDKIELF